MQKNQRCWFAMWLEEAPAADPEETEGGRMQPDRFTSQQGQRFGPILSGL